MTTVQGELFSDLFAYVLLFEQMTQQGTFQPTYEQVRSDIAALLERQEAAAKRQGMLEQDYQDARFAIVVWADETVLKHVSWEHHSRWNAYPLQLEYYQTTKGGEEFFERLERLRTDQKEIREIYYLCLGLGFSGRYFLGLEDELKLSQIRHDQAQHLPFQVEEVQNITRLMPQPYEVPPSQGKPIKAPLTQYLLKAGVALLIGVPLVLFLVYLFIPTRPTSKPTPPKPPPAQKPLLKPETVKQWLAAHQELLACAEVSVDAVDAQSGIVDLGGRVASETQRTEIRTGVQNVEGVAQVKDSFQIIPRPFCEVIELLEPFKAHAEAQEFGLAMQLNKEGVKPVYYQGENLVIHIQTPAPFESYVYVDYYTAAQEVGHLLPNPREPQNAFGPNSSFTVGAVDGPQPWKISSPFGLELITVIASKTPLFVPPRFDPESAATYLSVLREALVGVPASDVAATFYFLATRDQP